MQMSKENSTTIIEVIEYADSAYGPTQKNGPKNVFLGFYREKCKRHTDIL